MKDNSEKHGLTLRAAQIVAELAEMKRAFFVDGVERPMSIRVQLEAELANIRVSQIAFKTEENAKAMQIRQIRGEILRNKLVELGYPDLVDECNKLAEAQWEIERA